MKRQGSTVFLKKIEHITGNLPKQLIQCLGEAVAYWIFVIICIDSPQGFNWWLADRPHRFGIICIVYAIKALAMLILTVVQNRKLRESSPNSRFPWTDVGYFLNHMIFWIVSTIYAFDRELTTEHLRDPEWIKRYQKWNDEIFILPVVKLCVDHVFTVVGACSFPGSYTGHSMGGIIWMDLQYLFVYLFISGKNSWENYFIVFVWIYILSILATLGALCAYCAILGSLRIQFQGGKDHFNLIQYILCICITLMIFLFFVWENIVGSKDYKKENIYILLVALIFYTIYNSIQTFAMWKGINLAQNFSPKELDEANELPFSIDTPAAKPITGENKPQGANEEPSRPEKIQIEVADK